MSKSGCFLIVILLLASPIVWLLLPTRESFQAKRVSQAVFKLPIGATRDQVAKLLHREGLEASYVGDKQGLDFSSEVTNEGFNSSVLSGYYVAIVRNTSRTIIGECFTQWYFFLDKKGKLLKVSSSSGCVGL